MWDREAIDTMGPAFIASDEGGGVFRFICVEGDLDCEFGEQRGRPHVEWTWNGQDDTHPANGRGWATVEADGTLKGRFYIHRGDSSDFTAKSSGEELTVARRPKPRHRRR